MKWWDESWNPVVGCSPVSPACDNCYAARTAHRYDRAGRKYDGLTEYVEIEPRYKPPQWRARFNGRIHVVEDEKVWTQPLRWKKPRTVFVCNMGDLFHDDVPEEAIIRVLDVIEKARQHLFLLCTKRPGRTFQILKRDCRVFLNAWIGTTAESERWVPKRVRPMVDLRHYFKGTFVSYEPALGPIDWSLYPYATDLDWIVAGGESGAEARPSHPDWFGETRAFCEDNDIRFTFKQWGEWAPNSDGIMERVGKKRAGHILDGDVHEWIPRPKKE